MTEEKEFFKEELSEESIINDIPIDKSFVPLLERINKRLGMLSSVHDGRECCILMDIKDDVLDCLNGLERDVYNNFDVKVWEKFMKYFVKRIGEI